jgi:hypothetical protein
MPRLGMIYIDISDSPTESTCDLTKAHARHASINIHRITYIFSRSLANSENEGSLGPISSFHGLSTVFIIIIILMFLLTSFFPALN